MRYLTAFISLLLISGCNPSEVPVQIRQGVDSIAVRWVTDEREGICSIDLKILSDKEFLIKGETNIPEAKKEITDFLIGSGLTVHDSINILPDTSAISKIWGLVSVSVCNIKKEPSHSSEMVSQAIMGTPVKILKKKWSWLLVQTPDYYIGWANDSGIEELNEEQIAEWKQSARLIYTAKSGDIFSEESDSEVVSDIVSGTIVNFIAEQKNYYVIELPDGRCGRINMRDSHLFSKWCSEIKPEAEKLIDFAKSLKGSPYLWGGTSTKMADCSGFVKTVYFTGGVILARDASQQFRNGTEIDISKSSDLLQPGDLVFFGRLNSKGEKIITHTGMYIGDTEVIHDSGMIRVNSLDSTRSNYSSYLGETIRGARRIIGTGSVKGVEHVAQHSWYNMQN
ncbi:MAG: C40 family peptidase [Bacteroidales bacterium]|nr:C40 family peptidase [Bacteroidales bacterium]